MKKIAKTQADKQINQRESGLNVNIANTANTVADAAVTTPKIADAHSPPPSSRR